jgi:hypothetical protein
MKWGIIHKGGDTWPTGSFSPALKPVLVQKE